MSFFWETAAAHADGADRRGKNEESDVKKRKKRRRNTKPKDKAEAATQTTDVVSVEAAAPVTLIEAHCPWSSSASASDEKNVPEPTTY